MSTERDERTRATVAVMPRVGGSSDSETSGGEAADDEARNAAESLGLPLLTDSDDPSRFDLILAIDDERWELRETKGPRSKPLAIDLLSADNKRRLKSRHTGRQPLARAVGAHAGTSSVIDTTAGLGADAWQLAAFGLQVTALERVPLLAAMLEQARQRALAHGDPRTRDAAGRLHIITADARQYLTEIHPDDRPDAIYLDPMYIPRQKVAVRKEMRICRMLAGDDTDAAELLTIARRSVRRRVVVKRHRLADPLGDKPDTQIAGKLVRYDIYVTPIANHPRQPANQ